MKHSKNKEKRLKKYQQLSQYERDRIEILLKAGHTQKDIADVLGRSPSSISREISRNRRRKRTKKGAVLGKYEASTAQLKQYNRRRNSKYQSKKIERNEDLKKYIIKCLKMHWSPDEISGRIREDKLDFYASKNLIYEWLYSVYGQRYTKYLCTKKYKPKKRKTKKTKKQLIPNRISIKDRPKCIDKRLDYGHWEADTIVSGKKTGARDALAVAYERKSRYAEVRKISNLKPDSMNQALRAMDSKLSIDSLTLDNGIENQYYEELGISTYFCEPYSSWQKGGVENANGMIRRFIPKGVDISKVTKKYLEVVLDIINNKPRKSLNYRTPREVAVENGLLLEE
jgi:IS30 family transposase